MTISCVYILPRTRLQTSNLPSNFWSCLEVVANPASIFWHSFCNSFTASLSTLGIGGTSPSDQLGNVRAAAMTAPSTKVSPAFDRPSTKKYHINNLNNANLNRHKCNIADSRKKIHIVHTVMVILFTKARYIED